jgi:hypothetical protein
MKTTLLYSIIALTVASCAGSYHEVESGKQLSVGEVSKHQSYQQLTTATGSRKKEIMGSDARTIDSAIARLVRQVPGGKFISNAKIYVVRRNYLAVSGNVWGFAPAEQDNSATATMDTLTNTYTIKN